MKHYQKYDIVVAGDLNADLLYNHIEKIPDVGEEILAHDFEMALGGSAAIMASNLAALGVSVSFVGVVGNDLLGDFLMDTLSSNKVHTEFVRRREGHKTGSTVVMNQGQDRANLTHAGAMATLSMDDFPWNRMDAISSLHLANPFVLPRMRQDLVRFFKACKDMEMITSLDPQWDVEGLWDMDLEHLLSYVDYFFPNKIEAQKLFGEREIVGLLNNDNCSVIVTDGENGAQLHSRKKSHYQQAYRMGNITDCIGAGDAFCAGFMAAIIAGGDVVKAMQQGAACGALCTQKAGGSGSFTSIEGFLDMCKQLRMD